MRSARLACVSFALFGAVSSHAEADVVGRMLAIADDQPGGTPPPAQSPDLTAWAGDARATTLPELLQISVQQAPALQSAKLDIAVAEARIQQTWARNDWLLQAKLTGSRTGDSRFGVSTSLGGSADVSHLLPTGGTVGLHVDSTYSKTSGSIGGFLDGNSWVNNLDASITQPLLKGRGRDLFDANERRAALARDVTVLAKRLVAIQTVQAVISAYWDLVLAERTVAITEQSLDLARERLRVTQIGADGGKTPR